MSDLIWFPKTFTNIAVDQILAQSRCCFVALGLFTLWRVHLDVRWYSTNDITLARDAEKVMIQRERVGWDQMCWWCYHSGGGGCDLVVLRGTFPLSAFMCSLSLRCHWSPSYHSFGWYSVWCVCSHAGWLVRAYCSEGCCRYPGWTCTKAGSAETSLVTMETCSVLPVMKHFSCLSLSQTQLHDSRLN